MSFWQRRISFWAPPACEFFGRDVETSAGLIKSLATTLKGSRKKRAENSDLSTVDFWPLIGRFEILKQRGSEILDCFYKYLHDAGRRAPGVPAFFEVIDPKSD
jgi:hypothetical protein